MLLFSPRMRADISAALVETEENWKLFESDAAGRNFFNRSRYFIDGASEVSVIHANDGLACSLDAIENLLVLDLEFGVSLCLFAYDLSEGVVLP